MTTPTVDVNDLISKIVASYHNPVLTLSTLPTMIPTIMSKLQTVKELTGAQKNDITMSVVNQLIDNSNDLDNDGKSALKATLSLIGPPLISSLVDASNLLYNFGSQKTTSHFVNILSYNCYYFF